MIVMRIACQMAVASVLAACSQAPADGTDKNRAPQPAESATNNAVPFDASAAAASGMTSATIKPSSSPAPDIDRCPEGTVVVFSCRVESGKTVALCLDAATRTHARYLFGNGSTYELTYPASPTPAVQAFHRTSLMFAGATGGYTYSFRNAGVRYAMYSVSGDEGLQRAGVVVVDPSGKRVADLKCTPDSLEETVSPEVIRAIRQWTPDPAAADAVR